MITLRNYQLDDVDKAVQSEACLIGSDMGVGKTFEALSIIDIKAVTCMPVLIVTPINTFDSWLDKIKKYMGANKVPTYVLKNNPKGRAEFMHGLYFDPDAYFIMNYEACRQMQPLFEKHNVRFSVVVADECQAISNRNAAQTKAFKKIKTDYKLAMSGTPSGSQPWNIWSILNWLYPKYWSSYWRFVSQYVMTEKEYIRKGGELSEYIKPIGMKDVDLLHMDIAPYYIRHNKKTKCCEHHPQGVMSELPDKTYETLYVDLNKEQRRVYNEMYNAMVSWLGEQEDTPLVAKAAVSKLTRLMQMTLATPEITYTTATNGEDVESVGLTLPSSKIDLVKQITTDYSDKTFLVYTNSKKAANLCGSVLQDAGIETRVITGDVKIEDRFKAIYDFCSGKARVIVATIRAIGEGIDGLQNVCDTIIFMNRDLSAIKNRQAEDRLHRGGQKNPVTIIDIQARDTLDLERIDADNVRWSQLLQLFNA